MGNSITVSIFMMTYNHEKFIAQALDSVLMQKVNFHYEIVLGEDCSIDNTREIVIKYAERYPEKFKLLLHETNVGAVENQRIVFENCKGKYIALCEGDDYWTDPLKLQKQVDFLEEKQGCALCFHDIKILQPNGIVVEDFITKVPKAVKLDQKALVVNSNFIHTPSVMFRSEYLNDMPSSYSSPAGDYLVYLWLTNFGDIGYIQESMGVYRYGVGIHSSKSEEKRIKEHFWVLLVATFFIKGEDNLELLENKILKLISGKNKWNELILDYSSEEIINKYMDLCNKLYQLEICENINNVSLMKVLSVLKNKILQKIDKH